MLRLLVAVTAALLLTIGLPVLSAAAHTGLESSDPAQGAQLTAPPATVILVFNDAISSESAEVSITVGAQPARQLTVTVLDDTLTASVPVDAGTPAGLVGWQVGYRVLSLDGHPVTGVVDFTVINPEPTVSPAQPSTTAATDPASSPSRTTASPPATESSAASTAAAVGSGGATASSAAGLAGSATPSGTGSGMVLLWVAMAVVVVLGIALILTRRRRTP